MSTCPSNWLVCVRCYTYNHSAYITDAMNGFSMQQTNFPYVCCIVDDASTDNEQEVISKYIDDNFDHQSEISYKRPMHYGTLIFARHKTNLNCYFAVVLLNENHNGGAEKKAIKRSYIAQWENASKYEALCEGDDYWTDPLKLQKQVDYLESHPDCSLCFHNVIMHWEDGSQPDRTMFEIDENVKYGGWDILNNCPIQTASIVLRLDILFSKLYARARKNAVIGDYPLFLTAASYGYLHGYHKPMSVYRKHLGGATNQLYSNTSIFYRYMRQLENIPIIFGKEYNSTVKDFVCSRYISNALGYAKKHMWKDVAKCIYRSFSLSISQTIKEIGKYLKFKLK